MSSATIIHPAWTDDRGTDVPDWTNATRVVESGWRFTPLSASEVTDYGRQGVVTMLKGTGPVDTSLTAHDRIAIDGVAWECEGQPQVWPSLTGSLAHVEVVLRQVTG